MVEYISQHKQLPATLPDHLRKHMGDYPQSFIPEEEFCTVCPGAVSLSRPILITEARILTIDGIVQDVSTFCRKCEDCGMIYRYQEFTDGVHNFNDYLLGLHLFVFEVPAPGERTRRSAVVLNTEFQKLQTSKAPGENTEWTVTEDHLLNELLNQEVEVVRKLCEECDLDPGGSRMDLIFRLKEMKTPESFDKVFQKIWGASGGWAAILCPCGIVYSLKGLLRAGSPRDYADLLPSWAHMPNKVVSSGLARQMNLRAPESVPLTPHEERLGAPTTLNIEGGGGGGQMKAASK